MVKSCETCLFPAGNNILWINLIDCYCLDWFNLINFNFCTDDFLSSGCQCIQACDGHTVLSVFEVHSWKAALRILLGEFLKCAINTDGLGYHLNYAYKNCCTIILTDCLESI